MKATKDLIEYENGLPQWVKIARLYDGFNAGGMFEVTIKTWENGLYKGIVDDEKVLDILNNYLPFNGEEKYQPPKER